MQIDKQEVTQEVLAELVFFIKLGINTAGFIVCECVGNRYDNMKDL